MFESFFPLTDSTNRVTLEFVDYTLAEPKYSDKECLMAGRTFSSPLRTQLRLILWTQEEGEEREISSIKEQEVYLCDIPLMTESGSFIINGAERVIVSQMRRAPGVFFDSETVKDSGSKMYVAKIIPYIGSWLDFEFDSKDILYFRIDKKRKIPISTLLRAMGMGVEDIIEYFYGKTNIFITKNGWATKFNEDEFLGKKLSHDLIDAKTNEVKAKEGTKLNKKITKQLIADGLENYILTENVMLGHVIAQDLTDNETGEVLLEAGNLITAEVLDV